MNLNIYYFNEPLQKCALSPNGIWFNNHGIDFLSHDEVISCCDMNFSLWLKYFTLKKQ